MESPPQNPEFRINLTCFKCSRFSLLYLSLTCDGQSVSNHNQLSVNNSKSLNQLAIKSTTRLHLHTEHKV